MKAYRNTLIPAVILLLVTLLIPAVVSASVITPELVKIVKGRSVVINTKYAVSRVSLSNPEAADMLVISSKQVYVSGKKFGATTLTLWSGKDIAGVYDIQIIPDITGLKRMLNKILPNDRHIKVMSSGSSITVSGRVSTAASLKAALHLAETVAPGKVVNLLRVDGVQQVQLEVRVAEMTRTALQRMGFNFRAISNNIGFYSFLNGLTKLDGKGGTTVTDSINSIVSYESGSISLTGFIDALKANGLVRILAEPNLVCVSGQTADFLAGGEIPIPIPQALGMVSIEFKPFGVGLKFTPTVLGSGIINLKVTPEVSDLDFSNAVNFSGYTIPALTKRKASTTIELADGQSFAIAGLISSSLRENANRFPVLGDVPVLGTLFRSNDFRKSSTELIIIVTAHLAKPIDASRQPLPTDGFREPSDYEFYMLGLLEGRKPASNGKPKNGSAAAPVVRPSSGFDGAIGHSWPK